MTRSPLLSSRPMGRPRLADHERKPRVSGRSKTAAERRAEGLASLAVWIDAEDMAALEEHCERTGQSKAEVIRELLRTLRPTRK